MMHIDTGMKIKNVYRKNNVSNQTFMTAIVSVCRRTRRPTIHIKHRIDASTYKYITSGILKGRGGELMGRGRATVSSSRTEQSNAKVAHKPHLHFQTVVQHHLYGVYTIPVRMPISLRRQTFLRNVPHALINIPPKSGGRDELRVCASSVLLHAVGAIIPNTFLYFLMW